MKQTRFFIGTSYSFYLYFAVYTNNQRAYFMVKLILPFLLFSIVASAQQNPILFQQQSWASFNLQTKFKNNWGTWFDAEIHTKENYFNQFSLATFRLAGTYYLKNKNKLAAGIGYTDFFPAEGHKYISVPERFTWQQFQWYHNNEHHKLWQWFRLEQRWKAKVVDDYTLANSSTFYQKLRYNITYQIPLNKNGFGPKKPFLSTSEELYLYYGATIPNHVLDQNRVFVGLGYALNKHESLICGVLNIFQENAQGTQYINNNVLRVTFFENIGF